MRFSDQNIKINQGFSLILDTSPRPLTIVIKGIRCFLAYLFVQQKFATVADMANLGQYHFLYRITVITTTSCLPILVLYMDLPVIFN